MDEKKETGRIEAFSDGVFAIAITLLILELQIPHAPDLLSQLLRQWQMFLAYLTSFASIGIMWINHHRLFNIIQRSSHMLLMLNLLLLLFITFLPYPTSLLAIYDSQSHPHLFDFTVAALFYSGTLVLIAISYNLLWRYATHNNRLISKETDQEVMRTISRRYLFGPLLYSVAVALAFLSPLLSLAMDALLAIFFAIPYA